MIDYILDTTGYDDLYYIGFSSSKLENHWGNHWLPWPVDLSVVGLVLVCILNSWNKSHQYRHFEHGNLWKLKHFFNVNSVPARKIVGEIRDFSDFSGVTLCRFLQARYRFGRWWITTPRITTRCAWWWPWDPWPPWSTSVALWGF